MARVVVLPMTGYLFFISLFCFILVFASSSAWKVTRAKGAFLIPWYLPFGGGEGIVKRELLCGGTKPHRRFVVMLKNVLLCQRWNVRETEKTDCSKIGTDRCCISCSRKCLAWKVCVIVVTTSVRRIGVFYIVKHTTQSPCYWCDEFLFAGVAFSINLFLSCIDEVDCWFHHRDKANVTYISLSHFYGSSVREPSQ